MGLFDKLFNKDSANVGTDSATYGSYRIVKETNKSITVINQDGETCTPTKRYLREIADAVGLVYSNDWNTQTFGAKLINFLNENIGQPANKPSSVAKNTRNLKPREREAQMEYSHYNEPDLFDFKFKKINWALNKKNIEKHYEELNYYGAILVFAYFGEDREETVIAGCDISDGLYDALDVVNDYKDEDSEYTEVYYTTVCEVYGARNRDVNYRYSSQFAKDITLLLESFYGCVKTDSFASISAPVICRYKHDDYEIVWITDPNGFYYDEIDGQNFDYWIRCAK